MIQGSGMSGVRVAACATLFALHAVMASALDFTPHGSQPGLAYALEDPSACLACHGANNAQSATFMPYSTWAGSMMANATRDPLFWAALDIANADAASIGKPGVGDYCLRCHTPRGWFNGHVVKTGSGGASGPGGESGCQLLGDHAAYEGKSNEYSGVDCHYCHRAMPNGPAGEPLAIGNADLWIDNATECTTANGDTYGGPCRRGPYTYASGDPLEAPHGWIQSDHHASSSLCGGCHDVSSPETDEGVLRTLIRADGSDSGRAFPIERTYTEWTRSLFADAILRDGFGDAPPGNPSIVRSETCQSCHMRSSEDEAARACLQTPPGSRTGNLPVHQFAGANTWIPAILRDLYADDIGFGRDEDFDRAIAAAREMLQSSASVYATVTGYSPPASGAPGSLGVRVEVANLSGHKLPTGYAEGRRMWVNVEVRDALGTLVGESGAYDAITAQLGEDAQARVYEALQGIWNPATNTCEVEQGGAKKFHFVLNNCVAKDNRIPPIGFRPRTPDDPDGDEVSPVGIAYPETSPGSGILENVDRIPYAFALPASASPPFSVVATLYYQTASREYIEFLRDQSLAAGIPAENDLCAGGPGRPFDVGPQSMSRAQFMFSLWSDPAFGKSPPEPVATSTTSTTR